MSMFSQHHYTAVADTIGLTLRQIDQHNSKSGVRYYSAMAVHQLTTNLITTFEDDNSRFKTSLFNRRIGLVRREGLQTQSTHIIPTPEEMDLL